MLTPILALALSSPPPPPVDPQTAAIALVQDARLSADVQKLASFGTRHTLSDTASPDRGIGAARDWIKAELEKCAGAETPRLTVAFEEFDAPKSLRLPAGGRIVNVLATLPGSMKEAADRRYYIVAHYDSRNGDPMDAAGDAPGANDNASGTAVVLECARVLSTLGLDSAVVFLLTAGEEQGLIGASYHAAQAAGRGEKIMGVLNNDIVGDPSDPYNATNRFYAVRIFSEGIPRNPSAAALASIRLSASESDSPSRQLARFVESVGAQHENILPNTLLVFRPDRFLRGGDHLAFNDNGFAAVRFTVLREHFDRQHVNVETKDTLPYGDLPRYTDSSYMARIAKLNLATIMNLANAPRPPADVRIVSKDLGNETLLRWTASPEPDVIGYEVLYRPTSETAWPGELVRDAGRATELTLKISKDDHFFGVRAYDRKGYRSPVAFAGTAKE
jgi:hypothetical protein